MGKPSVLVIASLGPPPYVGGIENVVQTLLESELRERFDLAVFDTYRTPDPSRTRWAKARYATSLPRACWARLRESRPDLVHIHFCSRVDFWKHAICLVVSTTFGAKTVFHLHGGSFDAFVGGMSTVEKVAAKRVFGLADRVIALSSYWKEFLGELCDADRIRVLNNPIDCGRLAPGPRSPDPDRPTALLLGSLGRRKGHYDVVACLPSVLDAHPGLKVLFAGGDEDHGATEDLKQRADAAGVGGAVEFLGPVGFDEKVELLRTATVMILPSYGENMPISVLEAMAARLPVIATRVGAVPEVLDDGSAGVLIAPGDTDELAQSLIRVLDDPAWAANLGDVAGERARELWDVQRIAGRLETIYRDLL